MINVCQWLNDSVGVALSRIVNASQAAVCMIDKNYAY